jgi:hypothetical protein
MATRKQYELPYEMMQLIQSDPDLMNAFTSFNQNVTPEMTPGSLKSDNLIQSLRSPTPAATGNPGFNLQANSANANGLQTRNYTNQIFSPEVLKYQPGTALTEPETETDDADTSTSTVVTPVVDTGSNGFDTPDSYDNFTNAFDNYEMPAFEDRVAVAPVVTTGYSDSLAAEANLSDDPMQALIDVLAFDDAFNEYAEANPVTSNSPSSGSVSYGGSKGSNVGTSNPNAYSDSSSSGSMSYGGSKGSNVGTSNPNAYSDSSSSGGGGGGDSCCFIMLEARYGNGTMDNVVRKYRNEMMTDKNRRGYYKLAEVFVPLMRKSKVFKFIVQKTFADPLVSYGKWHYKENKHGWIFAPIKNMWMKVFDVLGGNTEFIRENGQVV